MKDAGGVLAGDGFGRTDSLFSSSKILLLKICLWGMSGRDAVVFQTLLARILVSGGRGGWWAGVGGEGVHGAH